MVSDVGIITCSGFFHSSLGIVCENGEKDSESAKVGIESAYGSISSTILNFFSGYYRTHYTDEDYCIVRSGQYSYHMYVGEVASFSPTLVKFKMCDVINYIPSSSSYDSTPYYTTSSHKDFSVDMSMGAYPSTYCYSSVVGAALSDIDDFQMDYQHSLFTGSICLCICISMLFYLIKRWLTRHDRKS